MRILVLGFYNKLNAGDDRLQACLSKPLEGHDVFFGLHHFSYPTEFLNWFDWVLIGGGGLVWNQIGIWKGEPWKQARIKCHFGVIGLGINSVNDKILGSLHSLADRAHFFYVRDPESATLMGSHKNVSVSADITWAYPLHRFPAVEIKHDFGLSLARCWWRDWSVADWVETFKDIDFLPLALRHGKNSDLQFMTTSGFRFPGTSPKEFNDAQIDSVRVVIAARYHCAIFALQKRKPVVMIEYDDKVGRLARQVGGSEFLVQLNDPQGAKTCAERLLSGMTVQIAATKSGIKSLEDAAQKMCSDVRSAIDDSSAVARNKIGYVRRILRRLRP